MWSKLNICFTAISDPEQPCMCRFGWIQWPAVQMCFIKRIFVLFMLLFLKKMGIILSASKPHYHSRLRKPILKIAFLRVLISECLFSTHIRVFANAKYPILFIASTSATKNVSFNLGCFKYFWDKHCEFLVNSSL